MICQSLCQSHLPIPFRNPKSTSENRKHDTQSESRLLSRRLRSRRACASTKFPASVKREAMPPATCQCHGASASLKVARAATAAAPLAAAHTWQCWGLDEPSHEGQEARSGGAASTIDSRCPAPKHMANTVHAQVLSVGRLRSRVLRGRGLLSSCCLLGGVRCSHVRHARGARSCITQRFGLAGLALLL